jgi:NAD(P)-dependent dehydrogenase (short-subunit alcohol dehydrogenase family)
MDLQLAGRAVVVSGAASMLGRACAWAFAREGARVALLDVDAATGRALAGRLRESLGAEVTFVAADVTVELEVAAALRSIAARFEALDVLVWCVGDPGPFSTTLGETTVEAWDAATAAHTRGPFLLVKHAYRHLAASDAPAVVLLDSHSSVVTAPGLVACSAARGAVLQLTGALSVELAEQRIRVNCVFPSIVDPSTSRCGPAVTGLAGGPSPVHTPGQVADSVLFLASPRSAPVNGTGLVSDFGLLA